MVGQSDRRIGSWAWLAIGGLWIALLAPDVQSAELPAQELARQIDGAIEARLSATNTPVSPAADDAEFIRRAYLDLHGVVPSAERVVRFLASTDHEKRIKLIDDLLASPQYGRNFGLIWFNRIAPRSARANGFVDEVWLAEQFNQNRGWDSVVAETRKQRTNG